MNAVEKQNEILDSIKKEYQDQKNGYSPQLMNMYVWFYPEKGIFMYNDFPCEYEVIYPMITSGVLIFRKLELHQGIEMLSYKVTF